MIKLKELIKEETKHSCDCGGDCCAIHENMVPGKVFTGHGFAFRKEELENSQGEQTDFKKGDVVKDINPDCPHHGSEGEVKKVGKGTITFVVSNNGKNYQQGDELEKTVDQMVKLKESDLGLTYKKGKTITVKHKKSGKELVIIDKPNVKREYEKIGYFAESVNEAKFTSDQIELLKMSWNTLKGINPSSPTYKKFIKFLDKLPKDELKQLANAKIKFVSILAKNRIKGESVKENLIYVDKDMKDGKFDPKNPQVHIVGYGVMSMKTIREKLFRVFKELSMRAKKGEIENVNSYLKGSGVVSELMKAYLEAKKQLKSSSMKRKITMYKRKR